MRPYGVRDGIDDLWPMAACTGREIMTEVLGHLRAKTTPAEKRLNSSTMPHAFRA